MKNVFITVVTIFAFVTASAMAGDRSFDVNNGFTYDKSTQSAESWGSGNSANSAGSGSAASQGATGAILFGLAVLVLLCIAACGSSDDNLSGSFSD